MSWRGRISAVSMGLVALVLVLGVVSAAWADFTVCSTGCDVSNLIDFNRTWTAATYWVWEHIQVQKKATLTLEPGVTLRFIPGTSLQVAGTLIAKGIEGQSITFTSGQGQAPPAPGDWGAILFTRTAIGASFDKAGNYTHGSILEHCVVEYAGGGTAEGAIWAKSPRAPFVYQSIIRYNKGSGIEFEGAQKAQIRENIISDNSGGGVLISKGTATISGNHAISRNGGYGIWVERGTFTVSVNAIRENRSSGISVFAGKATISLNFIQENRGHGISVYWKGRATISDNSISGNHDSGINVEYSGTATISSNSIRENRVNGIYVDGKATISGNYSISRNGYYGIYVYVLYYGKATIQENRIEDNTRGGIYVYHGKVTLSRNDIVGNTLWQLWNGNLAGSRLLDARSNWWGTTDEVEIQEGIWDWNDDIGLGMVDWRPYLTAPVYPQ